MSPAAYTCPRCGATKTEQHGRTCLDCRYRGDWIQPGEATTYAQALGRRPCDPCQLRGGPCLMPAKSAADRALARAGQAVATVRTGSRKVTP